MEANYIGIIDSGFGGLSVLNELLDIIPNQNYIFYADSINSPFGEKNIDTLLKITKNIINNLIAFNINTIIIACGTISTNLLELLKIEYPKINFIGTFPDFEHIFNKNLTLNNITLTLKNGKMKIKQNRKKMLILGTITTCKSKYLKNKINDYKDYIDIYVESAQKLVYFVENNKIRSNELDNYLETLLKSYYDINYIVLGCTHFPFLTANIKKFVNKNVIFLDGCKIVAKKVAKIATSHNSGNKIIKIIDTNINEYRKKMYCKLIKSNNYKISFNY